MARFDLNFQSFCVLYNILAPDFVNVCSDRSIKDADKVEGQKYAYYQSFGGPENHVLHLKSYVKYS